MSEPRHLISVLVENSPGELARIVGLFSGRGFNIDSLTVNTTLEPDKSRVVLTTRGDDRVVEQITKQLNKLVRVHKVLHIQGSSHLERELMLATITCKGTAGREEAERLFRLCGARVLSFSAQAFTVELTGSEARSTTLSSSLDRLEFGIWCAPHRLRLVSRPKRKPAPKAQLNSPSPVPKIPKTSARGYVPRALQSENQEVQ